MTIALFTYFAADNYGATLQAYSTIKALESLGHHVMLVNYVIDEPPRSALKNLLLYPKHLKFQKFRKKYFHDISQPYLTYNDLEKNPPKADCYLVGSDQTWNADISKDKARGYFLDFGDDNILRGSYSASIGKTVWEDTQWINKEQAQHGLDRFNFLSIRESSGVELLKKEFNKDATLVIDPVLLFKDYPELVGNITDTNEIVSYKLINSASFYDKVRKIGESTNLTCRSIGSIRQIPGYKHSYPESIEGWIRRIASAKYVVTDSFHGTVISILYHRPFVYCIGDPKRTTRITSLLKLLGLEDRFVNDNSSTEEVRNILTAPIDWDKVDLKLGNMRAKSYQFLIENLKKSSTNESDNMQHV